jgi:hypothetical protein
MMEQSPEMIGGAGGREHLMCNFFCFTSPLVLVFYLHRGQGLYLYSSSIVIYFYLICCIYFGLIGIHIVYVGVGISLCCYHCWW